jgi:hypothetical protein
MPEGIRKKALAKNAKADAKNIFQDRKFAKEPIIRKNYFGFRLTRDTKLMGRCCIFR